MWKAEVLITMDIPDSPELLRQPSLEIINQKYFPSRFRLGDPPLFGTLMACVTAAGRKSVTETKSCSVGCRFNCCSWVPLAGRFWVQGSGFYVLGSLLPILGCGPIVGRIWQWLQLSIKRWLTLHSLDTDWHTMRMINAACAANLCFDLFLLLTATLHSLPGPWSFANVHSEKYN